LATQPLALADALGAALEAALEAPVGKQEVGAAVKETVWPLMT